MRADFTLYILLGKGLAMLLLINDLQEGIKSSHSTFCRGSTTSVGRSKVQNGVYEITYSNHSWLGRCWRATVRSARMNVNVRMALAGSKEALLRWVALEVGAIVTVEERRYAYEYALRLPSDCWGVEGLVDGLIWVRSKDTSRLWWYSSHSH